MNKDLYPWVSYFTHRVRNPLTTLQAMIDIELSDDVMKKKLTSEIRRADKIINYLDVWSYLEGGDISGFTDFTLEKLIDKVVDISNRFSMPVVSEVIDSSYSMNGILYDWQHLFQIIIDRIYYLDQEKKPTISLSVQPETPDKTWQVKFKTGDQTIPQLFLDKTKASDCHTYIDFLSVLFNILAARNKVTLEALTDGYLLTSKYPITTS